MCVWLWLICPRGILMLYQACFQLMSSLACVYVSAGARCFLDNVHLLLCREVVFNHSEEWTEGGAILEHCSNVNVSKYEWAGVVYLWSIISTVPTSGCQWCEHKGSEDVCSDSTLCTSHCTWPYPYELQSYIFNIMCMLLRWYVLHLHTTLYTLYRCAQYIPEGTWKSFMNKRKPYARGGHLKT